ncbi:MAG: T9SS type A sorting domain-containing protein [Bacteroidota bacterium]
MTLRISSLLLCFLIPFYILQAQQHTCASHLHDLSISEERMIQNIFYQHRLVKPRSNTMDSVPVTIHLVVAPGFNEPGLSYDQIEAAINGANRVYGASGIFFYICGSPRIIDGAFTYNPTTAAEVNRQNYVPSTLNMYFMDDLFISGDFRLLGFANFPYFDPVEERAVYMDKEFVSDGATLIHELGHFYGLFHTHETFRGREFVNGTNCDSAGDLLCDTPADPNLGTPGFLAGCTYVANVVDPNGDPYTPPGANYMSYAPSACVREFSIQQQEVIRSVHLNENSYLVGNCDFYPDFAVDSDLEDRTITSIQDLFVNYNFTNIGLEEDYEVNFKVTLFDDVERTIGVLLYEERVLLSELENNKELFVFVDIPERKTRGEYFLVAEIDADGEVIERTEQNNLSITVITIDNSQFQDLSLFPNPTQDDLFVFFRDTQITGAFTVRIFRYDGVEVLADQGNKIGEEFLRKLDVSNLNRGLYLALIDFEDRNFTKTFKFYKH